MIARISSLPVWKLFSLQDWIAKKARTKKDSNHSSLSKTAFGKDWYSLEGCASSEVTGFGNLFVLCAWWYHSGQDNLKRELTDENLELKVKAWISNSCCYKGSTATTTDSENSFTVLHKEYKGKKTFNNYTNVILQNKTDASVWNRWMTGKARLNIIKKNHHLIIYYLSF